MFCKKGLLDIDLEYTYSFFFVFQLPVSKETSGWLVERTHWKAASRCATTTDGALSVTMPGVFLMQLWLVASWDILMLVSVFPATLNHISIGLE